MQIDSISFKHFSPFVDSTIHFPRHGLSDLADVQLLTGQNGTGKTRLLSALAAACGNTSELDSRWTASASSDIVVQIGFENGVALYVRSLAQTFFMREKGDAQLFLNEWAHHTANRSATTVDVSTGVRHTRLRAGNFEKRECSFVDNLLEWRSALSPFSAQAYRGSVRITEPTGSIEPMRPLQIGAPKDHLVFDRQGKDDDVILQCLVNLKFAVAMDIPSETDRSDSKASRILERFQNAISEISGQPFSFRVRPQPQLRLVEHWAGREMNLSGLPDGLRAILGWLVACIAKLTVFFPDHPSPLDIPLVLMIDEPETHLHPAWQRQVIPVTQKLFPNAQIFVATHSPFVISSVNSGYIHVLRMDRHGLVTAEAPKPCSKGDSWIDAVEDVLGVTEWYDPETEALLTEFRALKRKTLAERGDLNSLKEKAEAIASRSESLRSMMAREMHQLQRNMAEAVAEP